MLIGCLDIFSKRKQTRFFFLSEMHNKHKKSLILTLACKLLNISKMKV